MTQRAAARMMVASERGQKLPPDEAIDLIAQLGQQGDYFGSLNALFTGVGFAALVFTLILQIHESEANRESRLMQIREGYLTARIDAAIALFEACKDDAIVQFSMPKRIIPTGFVPIDEKRLMKLKLDILLCEAEVSGMTAHQTNAIIASPYKYSERFLQATLDKFMWESYVLLENRKQDQGEGISEFFDLLALTAYSIYEESIILMRIVPEVIGDILQEVMAKLTEELKQMEQAGRTSGLIDRDAISRAFNKTMNALSHNVRIQTYRNPELRSIF